MVWSRALRGIILLCVPVIAGCTASAPVDPDESSGPATSTASDSVERTVAERENRPSSMRDDAMMEALRAAYVDGAYEEVVRRARQRRRDSPDSSDVVQLHTLLGRAEQARGNHASAIEALQAARAAAAESNRPVEAINRALGDSYAALARWPEAAAALRRVLEAKPDDRAAQQALAEVHRRSRNRGKAHERYARLLRADSSNGR